LLGQTGLPLFLALLLLEALQRCQKPRRLWLAIDHGDRSFRNIGEDISCCSSWLRRTSPIARFVENIDIIPSLSLMRSSQSAVNSFVCDFFGEIF
jgi:hypothetical protein